MAYEDYKDKWMDRYPTIQDLEKRAKKRIPHVAYDYMQTGTSHEKLILRNLDKFTELTISPQFLKGEINPQIGTSLFGKKYNAPFGVAPIGLTGLMWPEAEIHLAKMARKYGIPSCLSTLATETPETVGPHVGDMGWFQLYTPRDKGLRREFLKRAKDAGYHTLLITVDVPIPSRRERTKRAGLNLPLHFGPKMMWEGITHPAWTIATLRRGLPRLRMADEHSEYSTMMSVGKFVEGQLGGNLSWSMCEEIKNEWVGPVVLKGILNVKDAVKAAELGMDGIVVSNHGGRQFDGGPTSLEVLPEIVNEVGQRLKIIFDSGVRSGLDTA